MFNEQTLRIAIVWGMQMGRTAMLAEHDNNRPFDETGMIPAYIDGLKKAQQYLKEVDDAGVQ